VKIVPTSAKNTIWNVAKNAQKLAQNVQKLAKCKKINSIQNAFQKHFVLF
jgi:hypothetical protein